VLLLLAEQSADFYLALLVGKRTSFPEKKKSCLYLNKQLRYKLTNLLDGKPANGR
jgi:hypothetical protein